MPEPIDPSSFDDSDTRPSLAADLASLFGAATAIPARIDEQMIAQANRHAARIRRMRLLLRWGGGAAAVAAMVLVALRIFPSHPAAFQPGQHVTILDAFSLSRQIKHGAKIDTSWDI